MNDEAEKLSQDDINQAERRYFDENKGNVDINHIKELATLRVVPDVVLALWKCLAYLWNQPAQGQEALKLASTKNLVQKLLEFDIKNVT